MKNVPKNSKNCISQQNNTTQKLLRIKIPDTQWCYPANNRCWLVASADQLALNQTDVELLLSSLIMRGQSQWISEPSGRQSLHQENINTTSRHAEDKHVSWSGRSKLHMTSPFATSRGQKMDCSSLALASVFTFQNTIFYVFYMKENLSKVWFAVGLHHNPTIYR